MAPSVQTSLHEAAAALPLDAIAASVGTPAYVYDAPAIRSAYRELDAALGGVAHALHYALKANSTLAIARLLCELGSGADANSVGEIEVALRAGFDPSRIVFTGVGKTSTELERAIVLGVHTINAESPGELQRIAALARAHRTTARVALRVNPDIDARSHPHISTGLRTNKFGVPIESARALFRQAASTEGLRPVGVHVHVGSQITSLDPLTSAAARIGSLVDDLLADGLGLDHVDLGGGLGISYDGSSVPSLTEYAAAIVHGVARTGLTLVLEPGRALVGAAGLLITRVVDVKEYPGGPRFAILDAGMTELLRPALYNAFHRIVAVSPRAGEPRPYEVVGPLCESSDIFGRDRLLPPLEPGDLLAVLDTGAYGAAMASTYNRRPLPPEVLVDGDGWRVIRRRQTIDDLVALESVGPIPRFMPGLLIAFEGLDQSGKQTQAHHLAARLEALGHRVRLASFPDYSTPIGREIGRALRDEHEYPADVMQLLYIANRYERKPELAAWLAAGDIVLCDRYLASSVAYGETQGLDAAWLADTQRHLPLPDLTILLDIAPATAVARKALGRDRYERDLALLTRVRESYRRQADVQGWARLDGERGKDDLAEAIFDVVAGRLSLR